MVNNKQPTNFKFTIQNLDFRFKLFKGMSPYKLIINACPVFGPLKNSHTKDCVKFRQNLKCLGFAVVE